MLSHQEIYDKALFGVRAQGRLSADVCACLYRMFDDEGTRVAACGVGQLIPDNDYLPAFDASRPGASNGVMSMLDRDDLVADAFRNALSAGGVDWDDVSTASLLSELQVTHDGSTELRVFEARMKALARNEGLVYTPAVTGNEVDALTTHERLEVGA